MRPPVGSTAGVRIIPKPARIPKILGAGGSDGHEFAHQLRKARRLGRAERLHAAYAAGGLPERLASFEHRLFATEEVAEVLLVAGHALATDRVHFVRAVGLSAVVYKIVSHGWGMPLAGFQ